MMRVPGFKLTSVLGLSAFVLLNPLAVLRGDVFKPGSSLPEVELISEKSGKSVNLAKHLKGKKTALFIFASW